MVFLVICLILPHYCFLRTAIRQSISKALVAYYQKCKHRHLTVTRFSLALDSECICGTLQCFIVVFCWGRGVRRDNRLISLVDRLDGSVSLIWLFFLQTWMRPPRRRSRTSWSSTIGPCWWLTPVGASPRSLVDLEPVPATRSLTVNLSVHFLIIKSREEKKKLLS